MPLEERDRALIYDMLDAARQVSDMTKAEHADIDWRRIVALRNVIVHEYGDVDYARHWRVIQEDLPKLIARLERIDL